MKLWMLFTFSVIFFFVSCGPMLKIQSDYQSEGFAMNQLKGKNVKLFVNPGLNILDYNKSFENEYQTEKKFNIFITSKIMKRLTKSMSISIGDTNDFPVVFNESLAPNLKDAQVKEYLVKATEDYIIIINKIVISGSINFGGMGGNTEQCAVTIKADAWSVKENQKVLRFSAFGNKNVSFFMYGTALKGAVDDAMTNFCSYFEVNK